MSEVSRKRVYDGFASLEGGVDSGLEREFLDPNQAAWSINVTYRGGKARTRPPLVRRQLAYQSSGYPYPDDIKATIDNALWQTAIAYLGDNGVGSLLFMAGGRVYQIAVQPGSASFPVTDVSPPDATNPTNLSRGWAVQGEQFAIFQDSQTKPIIFNGSGCRYARNNEIKTGTVMAYQNGRIWYAVGTTGLAFRATDLVGNRDSGTPGYNYRDSILRETENDFLNEGGDFAVPSSSGPITAMAAPAQLDTSQGQGPLQVLTTGAIFSVNAPIDREIWKDVDYPIQTYSMIEKGAVGWAVLANGDIWYRSLDGIRSFIVARREFGQAGNTPQSSEMSRLLDYDNGYLLPFGNAVLFDNRLLCAAAPALLPNGSAVHDQLGVLDFRLVSGIKKKLPASWEGVWTGLRIHQIVKGMFNGIERCFIFARDAADTELQLWELLPDIPERTFYADSPALGTYNRIPCVLESRSLDFQNDNALKRLDTSGLFVSNLSGTVGFDVKYRPDNHPCWLNWHSWSECATQEQCFEGDGCVDLKNLQPQYRPKSKLPLPNDNCNTSVSKIYRDFFQLQLRLQWEGQAKIDRLLAVAIDIPEPSHGECLGTQPCKEINCCDEPLEYDAGDLP